MWPRVYDGRMEDRELRDYLARIEEKAEAARRAAEDTKRYFLWLVAGSIIAFLLPLLGLVFAVPALLSIYSSLGSL